MIELGANAGGQPAHGEGDGGRLGIRLAVIDLEGEAIGALVARRRGVFEFGCGARQRAMGGTGQHREGQWVLVDVAGGQLDLGGRVHRHRQAPVTGHWRMVHMGHGEAHRGRRGHLPLAVGHREGEVVHTLEIQRRRVG